MTKNIKKYLALTMLCALFATLPVFAFEGGEEKPVDLSRSGEGPKEKSPERLEVERIEKIRLDNEARARESQTGTGKPSDSTVQPRVSPEVQFEIQKATSSMEAMLMDKNTFERFEQDPNSLSEAELYRLKKISHEMLGLDPMQDYTDGQINRFYKREALLWHPDKIDPNNKELATEVFKQIGQAKEFLTNENLVEQGRKVTPEEHSAFSGITGADFEDIKPEDVPAAEYPKVTKSFIKRAADWVTSLFKKNDLGSAKDIYANRGKGTSIDLQTQELDNHMRTLDTKQKEDVFNEWIKARSKTFEDTSAAIKADKTKSRLQQNIAISKARIILKEEILTISDDMKQYLSPDQILTPITITSSVDGTDSYKFEVTDLSKIDFSKPLKEQYSKLAGNFFTRDDVGVGLDCFTKIITNHFADKIKLDLTDLTNNPIDTQILSALPGWDNFDGQLQNDILNRLQKQIPGGFSTPEEIQEKAEIEAAKAAAVAKDKAVADKVVADKAAADAQAAKAKMDDIFNPVIEEQEAARAERAAKAAKAKAVKDNAFTIFELDPSKIYSERIIEQKLAALISKEVSKPGPNTTERAKETSEDIKNLKDAAKELTAYFKDQAEVAKAEAAARAAQAKAKMDDIFNPIIKEQEAAKAEAATKAAKAKAVKDNAFTIFELDPSKIYSERIIEQKLAALISKEVSKPGPNTTERAKETSEDIKNLKDAAKELTAYFKDQAEVAKTVRDAADKKAAGAAREEGINKEVARRKLALEANLKARAQLEADLQTEQAQILADQEAERNAIANQMPEEAKAIQDRLAREKAEAAQEIASMEALTKTVQEEQASSLKEERPAPEGKTEKMKQETDKQRSAKLLVDFQVKAEDVKKNILEKGLDEHISDIIDPYLSSKKAYWFGNRPVDVMVEDIQNEIINPYIKAIDDLYNPANLKEMLPEDQKALQESYANAKNAYKEILLKSLKTFAESDGRTSSELSDINIKVAQILKTLNLIENPEVKK